MGIRISPLGIAVLLFSIALSNSLPGLAGPFSRVMVLFPLVLVSVSLIQVWYSYLRFGFHQEFSTDHPVRGEAIQYTFVLHYEGILPTCGIICQFTFQGPGLAGTSEEPVFLWGKRNTTWSTTFRCAYRGIYAVGSKRFIFKDSLGLFQFAYTVEPRIFYVYPEIIPLSQALESIFMGSGETGLRTGGGQEDVGVFESVYPLHHGEGARQIAWKRFAATGIPCAYRTAKATAPALRVVLDVRPPPHIHDEEERLIAEDMAVSLVFSVLRYMVEQGIPADFFCSSEAESHTITDLASFESLYYQSTSILFNDSRFPQAAWDGETRTLLVTLQAPFEFSGATSPDLYTVLEHRLRKGYGILLITVPEPSLVERVRKKTMDLLEQLPLNQSQVPCKVLDTRQGNEGITHVFE